MTQKVPLREQAAAALAQYKAYERHRNTDAPAVRAARNLRDDIRRRLDYAVRADEPYATTSIDGNLVVAIYLDGITLARKVYGEWTDSLYLVGQCPQCGKIALSSPVAALYQLGALLERFDADYHSCQPAANTPENAPEVVTLMTITPVRDSVVNAAGLRRSERQQQVIDTLNAVIDVLGRAEER